MRRGREGRADLCTRADMEKSFFVGDAAGRPATRGRSRDHSDSDLGALQRFVASLTLA